MRILAEIVELDSEEEKNLEAMSVDNSVARSVALKPCMLLANYMTIISMEVGQRFPWLVHTLFPVTVMSTEPRSTTMTKLSNSPVISFGSLADVFQSLFITSWTVVLPDDSQVFQSLANGVSEEEMGELREYTESPRSAT